MPRPAFQHMLRSCLILAMGVTCGLAGQPNLLQNADMESAGAGGLPAAWTSSLDLGSALQTWDTADSVSASHSVRTVMQTAGQADWRQLVTGISASVHYRFLAHIRASNTTAGSHAVELQWFDSTNTYLGATTFSASTPDTWSELILEDIIPPPGSTHVYVLLRTYTPGTYAFDDLAFVRTDKDLHTIDGRFPIGLYAVPHLNLVLNGRFTVQGNGSWPTRWRTSVDSGTATHTWITNAAASYVQTTMTTDGQADWRQRVKDIRADERYEFAGRIHASSVAPGSHGVELQWFDAQFNYLSRTVFAATNMNTWCDITNQIVIPPANAASAYILLRTYAAGTYAFDDLSLSLVRSTAERYEEARHAGFTFVDYYEGFHDLGWTPGTLDEIGAAGLKVSYNLAWDMMYSNDTLVAKVNAQKAHPAVAFWQSVEEGAWVVTNDISAPLIEGYETVRAVDDHYESAPHRVWMNHAPRGTPAAPADFSTLRSYTPAADIFSIDIYPVPEGIGHSILSQSPACVGEYVDVLNRDVLSTNGIQEKPIWMVLQGFGWGDLPLFYETPDLHAYDSHAIELQWFTSNNVYIASDKFSSEEPGAWYSLSNVRITPPPDAAKVWLLLRAYQPGDSWFDDITLAAEGGTNLIVNSDFETRDGTNNAPAGWLRNQASGAWDTARFASASHAVKITLNTPLPAQDWAWGQFISTVNPGSTYVLTGQIFATQPNGRRPTWKETRFMAYNAIIHGARGILYWGTLAIPANSELWGDIKRLVGELDRLSPVLTAPTSLRTVTRSTNAIETTLFELDANLYLLAANHTGAAVSNVTFGISGLPLTVIREEFDRSSRTVVTNRFSDDFADYQVRVYRIPLIPLQPAVLDGLTQIQPGVVHVSVANPNGTNYWAESATNLASVPVWTTLGPAEEIEPGIFEINDPENAQRSSGFYRLIER